MSDLNDVEPDNPRRRDGGYLVFDFAGSSDRLPSLLIEIAAWLRACTEYALEQLAVAHGEVDEVTISVTVREMLAGDVIEALTKQGYEELAADVADLVYQHGRREGLRLAGFGTH